jgi:outer membrane protein OmpA-like peptidoglycan-associated protein
MTTRAFPTSRRNRAAINKGRRAAARLGATASPRGRVKNVQPFAAGHSNPTGKAMDPAQILQLQQLVGNRAVQRLVARPPAAPLIQKAPDEEKESPYPKTVEAVNLASPVLMGDATLEKCLDGVRSAYLRFGSKGGHVAKVKQALISLGFPISSTGDSYDGETYKAVKAFQAKAGMTGSDVDGIVGKKTIALLDMASRRGETRTDEDEKAGDFKTTGKYLRAKDEPDTTFFDLASAELDGAEEDKVKAFAGDHKETDITLIGYASEEGPKVVNKDLINQRIARVAALLKEAGHPADKIHELPHLKGGEGKVHYRKMRKVELVEGHKEKPEGKTCGKDAKEVETCQKEGTDIVQKAAKRAVELIDAAEAKLPPSGANKNFFDKLFGTDDKTRDKTVADLKKISAAVKSHIATLPGKDRHFCGTDCHPGCQAGWKAYNSDKQEEGKPEVDNPPGIMTLCPVFFTLDPEIQAIILTHEGHHGTPGIHSRDYAYHHERLLFKLDTDIALKNGSTYHVFVLHFSGSKATEIDPETAQVGPKEKDVHDKDLEKNPAQKEALDQSIAWIEHWIKYVDGDISSSYAATKKARQKGRWPSGDEEGSIGTWIMYEYVAPRFNLTKPYAYPSERDLVAQAAIFDRLKMMAEPFNAALNFDKEPAGKTEWERGSGQPGSKVTVNDHFFALKPSQQVTVLLQELVHATPGISAAHEPEYVLLVERLSRDFHKKVGPKT